MSSKKSNWYKKAKNYKKANRYGYHGTDITKIEDIELNGLNIGSFFAGNESDISPYADGVWLRFPFPTKYQKRIGLGDYYVTQEIIPPQAIEIKTGVWEDYRRL